MIGQVWNIFVHLTFDIRVVTSLVHKFLQAWETPWHLPGGTNVEPTFVQRWKEGKIDSFVVPRASSIFAGRRELLSAPETLLPAVAGAAIARYDFSVLRHKRALSKTPNWTFFGTKMHSLSPENCALFGTKPHCYRQAGSGPRSARTFQKLPETSAHVPRKKNARAPKQVLTSYRPVGWPYKEISRSKIVWLRHKAVRKTESWFSEALGRDWDGIGTKCKTFGRKASNAEINYKIT